LSVDYHDIRRSLPLAERTRLPIARDSAVDNLGREFPPIADFDVSHAQTRLAAAVRHSDCWQREATLESLAGIPFKFLAAWRGQWHEVQDFGKIAAHRMRIVGLDVVKPEELELASKSAGLDCGQCEGWSRIQADVMDRDDRPFGPPSTFPDAPMNPAPWRIDIFIEATPDALEPWLGRFMKCAEDGADKFRRVAGERIYSMPTVELGVIMFDSAAVESGKYVEYPSMGAHSQWSVEGSYTVGNKRNKTVQLLEACLGQPQPCWEGRVESPPIGFVWVDGATSGTTMPRMSLSTSIGTGAVAAYGARSRAVQGYFDRSWVELYTAIPQIYVDTGVSAPGFDYRGGSELDWRHDSDFPEPDGVRIDSVFRHTDSPFSDWLNPHAPSSRRPASYTAYRADWTTDTLRLARRSHAEQSYCALPEQLSAVVDTIGFSGACAGVAGDRSVQANVVFPDLAAQVIVVGSNWRWGSTAAALRP